MIAPEDHATTLVNHSNRLAVLETQMTEVRSTTSKVMWLLIGTPTVTAGTIALFADRLTSGGVPT